MNPTLLLRQAGLVPPSWTQDERLNARANWLRVGQTVEERRNRKFSRAMAFAGMDTAEKDRMIEAAHRDGCTHFVFERELVRLPSYWTWDRPMVCSPERMLEAAQILVSNDLKPVPLLLTQDEVRSTPADLLVTKMEPYRVLADWCAFVWLFFEVNESVTLKDSGEVDGVARREGMRADDWITYVMGRFERTWGLEMGVHWTGNERHYHDRYENKSLVPFGEPPPFKPILLFQFDSWDAAGEPYSADLSKIMQYKLDHEGNSEPLPSGVALARDWVETLNACQTHSPRMVVLPWEYCPFDWDSTPQQFEQMGDFLVTSGRNSHAPHRIAYGNGGTL